QAEDIDIDVWEFDVEDKDKLNELEDEDKIERMTVAEVEPSAPNPIVVQWQKSCPGRLFETVGQEGPRCGTTKTVMSHSEMTTRIRMKRILFQWLPSLGCCCGIIISLVYSSESLQPSE